MFTDQKINGAGELRRYAVAAKRIGVSADEYGRRVQAGEKWCSYGKHWAPSKTFGVSGLGRIDSYCSACRQRHNDTRRLGASPRHT